MRAIQRSLDLTASLFKGLAALCLGIMVVLNLGNVLSRSILGTAYGWVFSWTLLLFVWMILLGFFVYVRTRRDVVVDIFMTRLPNLPRRGAALFGCAVGIAVMLAILRGAPALISMQSSPMDIIGLPIWVRSAPLFVAATLVLIHFSLEFFLILAGRTPAFPRNDPAKKKGVVE